MGKGGKASDIKTGEISMRERERKKKKFEIMVISKLANKGVEIKLISRDMEAFGLIYKWKCIRKDLLVFLVFFKKIFFKEKYIDET